MATNLRALSFSMFWRSHSAKVTASSRAASGCFHGASGSIASARSSIAFLAFVDQVAAGKAGVGVVLDAVIFIGVENAALQRQRGPHRATETSRPPISLISA